MALFVSLALLLAAASTARAVAGPRRAPLLDFALRRMHRRAADAAHDLGFARGVEFARAFEPDLKVPGDALALLRTGRALQRELADECRATTADDPCLVAQWDAEYDACFVSRVCEPGERRTTIECTDRALDTALAQAALLDEEEPSSATLAERRCADGAIVSIGFLAHFDPVNGTCAQIDIGASRECRERFSAHPLAQHAPWLALVRALGRAPGTSKPSAL